MNRGRLVLTAAILLLPFTSKADSTEGAPSPEVLPLHSVVTVLNYDWKGDLVTQGSGFFVSGEGDLLVPTWVLEGGSWAEVRLVDGSVRSIDQVVAVDEYGGLMRVRLKDCPSEIGVVKAFGPIPGSGEAAVRLTADGGVTENLVRQSRIFPGLEEFSFLELSEALGPPGSPLFRPDGRLAGVVLFSRESSPKQGVVVSSESALLLARVKDEGIPHLGWVEEAHETWKSCFVGKCLRGMTFAWAGDFDEARQPLEDAVSMGGGAFDEVFACLGDCYAAGGQNSHAAEVYRRALSLRPSRVDLYSKLVFVLLEQGLGEDAAEVAEQAVGSCPQRPESHILLARVLNARGQYLDALEAASASLQMDSHSPEGYLQAGIASIGLGQYADAVDQIRQSLEERPGDPEALAGLGYAHLREGRVFNAIVVLSHAASEMADSAEVFKALGEAYSSVGLSDRAVKAYRMALSVNSMDRQAYWRLADACIQTGEFDEAVAVCRQALALAGQNPWLLYKLGKAYCVKGDLRGAAEQVLILQDLNQGLADQLQLRLDAAWTAAHEGKDL